MTETELNRLWRERQSQDKRRIRALVDAVVLNDREALCAAFEPIEMQCLWKGAMRALSRLRNVPDEMKCTWLQLWAVNGDHLRNEVGKDLIMIEALRQLLPPYEGSTIRLYRGDSAWNRRCRAYGPSWTASREVATGFARGIWQAHKGGSVVLETDAPAEAVICALHLHPLPGRDYQELEYLEDRRKLDGVRVVEHFAQRDIRLASEEAGWWRK